MPKSKRTWGQNEWTQLGIAGLFLFLGILLGLGIAVLMFLSGNHQNNDVGHIIRQLLGG